MNRTGKNEKSNWRNKLHWRALFVLAIYVSFAAGARSMLPGTALAAPIQEAEQAAEEQAFQKGDSSRRTGLLAVIHGDPPEESGQETKLRFQLTDDAGKTRELEISDEVIEAAGGFMELQNRRVVVSIDETKRMFGEKTAEPVANIRPADRALAGGEAAKLTGTQRWISIACKFSDISAEPKNLAYFQGMYGSAVGRLNHYWKEVSSNSINIDGSTAVNWRTLPQPRSHYITGSGANLTALFNDCTAVQDPFVHFPSFVGINMMFNANLDCCAWGGGRNATLDGVTKFYRVTWEPPWGYANAAVIAHEMGHGFGLPHANNWDQDGNPYDNPWDVMSSATGYAVTDATYGKRGKHICAYHKDKLGWIPAAQKSVITSNGTYNLSLDRLSLVSTSNYRMVKIPITSTRYWMIEARKRVGAYDSALPGDAVLIYEVNTNRATSEKEPAWLFDADSPAANFSDNEGSMFKVGETFTHSASQLSVKVMSATANGFNIRITKGSSASAQVTQLWSASSATAPGTLKLWARVKNTGTAALPASAKVLFYVTGPSWTGSHYVGTPAVGTLAPGASKWVSFTWSISGSRPAGAYKFWARTSSPNSAWKGPRNFTVASTAGPKAQILQLWPVSGATTPGKARLWARVKNIGTVAFPTNATVQYWASGPSWAGSHIVGTTSVAGLAPGAISWRRLDWTISFSRRAGNYRYYARVITTTPISSWKGPQTFAVGFDSQFNGTAPYWSPVNTSWFFRANAFYTSNGLANQFASTRYTTSFHNFNFRARLFRTGSNSSASGVMVRGTPTPPGSAGRWKSGYAFYYTRDGRFSIFKYTNGMASALQSWTSSTAIKKFSAWNSLQVIANGSSLRFYINGIQVWSGTDTAYTVGQVGLIFYRNSTAGRLYANNAKLIGSTADQLADEEAISDGQLVLNDAAIEGLDTEAPSLKP